MLPVFQLAKFIVNPIACLLASFLLVSDLASAGGPDPELEDELPAEKYRDILNNRMDIDEILGNRDLPLAAPTSPNTGSEGRGSLDDGFANNWSYFENHEVETETLTGFARGEEGRASFLNRSVEIPLADASRRDFSRAVLNSLRNEYSLKNADRSFNYTEYYSQLPFGVPDESVYRRLNYMTPWIVKSAAEHGVAPAAIAAIVYSEKMTGIGADLKNLLGVFAMQLERAVGSDNFLNRSFGPGEFQIRLAAGLAGLDPHDPKAFTRLWQTMNSVPGAMDLIARNILLNQSELNRTLTPQGAAFAHNMGYSGFRRFSGETFGARPNSRIPDRLTDQALSNIQRILDSHSAVSYKTGVSQQGSFSSDVLFWNELLFVTAPGSHYWQSSLPRYQMGPSRILHFF